VSPRKKIHCPAFLAITGTRTLLDVPEKEGTAIRSALERVKFRKELLPVNPAEHAYVLHPKAVFVPIVISA
jgi:hypothetical protein